MTYKINLTMQLCNTQSLIYIIQYYIITLLAFFLLHLCSCPFSRMSTANISSSWLLTLTQFCWPVVDYNDDDNNGDNNNREHGLSIY